jgi:hypothetical protein
MVYIETPKGASLTIQEEKKFGKNANGALIVKPFCQCSGIGS